MQNQENVTHNEETNQLTDTNSKLAQMLEFKERDSKIQIKLPEMETTTSKMKNSLDLN